MSQNICIYFSDTGGGHRGAADAVEAGVRRLLQHMGCDNSDVILIKDTIAEKSHPLNRFFVELYNYLLRHHQPLMKYYYWLLHYLKPESGLNLMLTEKYFHKLFRSDRPNVVVSVHPMISHCTAHALKVNGIKDSVKLVEIITDPNADLWRAWACPDADLVIAPNDVVKMKLLEWGIPAEKIEVLGMPVHPDFVTPPNIDKRSFLTLLGLAPDVMTVCINAGWAGGGNMLKIYRALSSSQRPLQCIFLCGHNTALYEKAMAAAAESNIPTAVLPFHDCMSDLMASVDVMVTKAGGLTTYQAIARRLPIIFDGLTEPMPQERGTIELLTSQGVAHSIKAASEIVGILDSLHYEVDRTVMKLPEAYNLNLTDSAPYMIAKRVLESCNPPIAVGDHRHPLQMLEPQPVAVERSAD
jgi:processive 1,2-diacylglycerol beta-glucosyltransferase